MPDSSWKACLHFAKDTSSAPGDRLDGSLRTIGAGVEELVDLDTVCRPSCAVSCVRRITGANGFRRLVSATQNCTPRRFHADAFAADPKLADDLRFQHRYNAARWAVLAAAGKGADTKDLDDKARARLRQQARDGSAPTSSSGAPTPQQRSQGRALVAGRGSNSGSATWTSPPSVTRSH